MCGIAGIYAYGPHAPEVDRQELRRVRDRMAPRGPDGAGEWYSPDGRVGLGHRRLAVIDLSERGAQPMALTDGSCIVSYNGEIYNHRELRADLEARGRVFRSDSDTEVLLHLYEVHGTGMLRHLRGMFAFAIWDARQRVLLLARDPFGIKPLYYADDGRALRFASQVKALLEAPVDTRPAPAGHVGFMLWGSVPAPWTLYRGIRSLPAGHLMQVTPAGARPPECYFSLTGLVAAAAAEPWRGSEDEAVEQIASAVRDSVRAHMVSDVPVGVFLSSGLDSAMLAARAATQGTSPRTLTLAFTEYANRGEDEAPLAQELARMLGTAHSTVQVQRGEVQGQVENFLDAMDQPSIDGLNVWLVSKAASEQGIKVALSGLGGDELFGSYPSFRDVPLIRRATAPLAHVPALGRAIRRIAAPFARRFTSPKYAGLAEYGPTLGGAYLLRRGLFMPWELPEVMDADLARLGWSELQALAGLEATTNGLDARRDGRLAVTALEACWYMRHQLLNDADWAAMAHSLELRVPLVDVPLYEKALPCLAAHPQISKARIAKAVAPQLPPSLLGRRKTGFSVPLREWLTPEGESARGLRGWATRLHARAVQEKPAAVQPRSGRRRVLVSTMAPGSGGVQSMTRFVVQRLEAMGMEPVIAYYEPYTVQPSLSVPSYRLLQRRPGSQLRSFEGHEAHAIGAWLPELEFTHYWPTRAWRDLMDSCDAYVAVSGNVLAATPFARSGRPYLAWVATDWHGDRKDRVRRFPLPRRLLDRWVNGPVIRRLERRLLREGAILALSQHTARELDRAAGCRLGAPLLPVPVDVELFSPEPQCRVPNRIGFSGRFTDPRKNIGLLLESAALLRSRGRPVEVVLTGDALSAPLAQRVADLGLNGAVKVYSGLSRIELRDCLRTLDVFVLPSHQEGLCISALEALACGVPVVSTRCGGPEEFVQPGVSGELVGADAHQMSSGIERVLSRPELRAQMAAAGRQLVVQRYGRQTAESVFDGALRAAFKSVCPGPTVALRSA